MAIAIILLLGLVLRLVNLRQSLWLDEAVQAITSRGTLPQLFAELKGDFHPPLYHLLMWVWVRIFGTSEISLRMPSALFGAGTVFIIYFICKRIFPQKNSSFFLGFALARSKITNLRFSFAELSALFIATAPFHIYYSQEARMYSMGTFLASLSMLFFIRLVSQPAWGDNINEKRPLVAYVVFSLLMLYTDYFCFLVLISQTLIVIIGRRLGKFSIGFKGWIPKQVIIMILFLPWLPMMLEQLKTGREALSALSEWGKLVNINFFKALPLTFIKFAIGRITVFNKKLYAIMSGILFLIYGGIFVRGFFKGKKLVITNYQLLITFWFLIPLLTAWLISLFIPHYQPFHLLLVLPAFYLLLAWGIICTKSLVIRIIELFMIIIINLTATGVYYFNPYFHREDWRGLVGYLDSQAKEASLAILPSQTSFWPYAYYSEGKVPYLGVGQGVRPVTDQDETSIKEKVKKSRRIFFIRYLIPLFDPQEKIIFWLEKESFVKIKEISFNQLVVWEYGLKEKETRK